MQRQSHAWNLVALKLLDATHAHQEPLDEQRLFTWHRWLFPSDDQLLARPLQIGALRGEESMQVVSGRIDQPTVHFEAPPRAGLEAQLADFLAWFDSSRSDANLDPFLRVGIAHLWFVILHPFDDGNGRLTRAITDLALAQGGQQANRPLDGGERGFENGISAAQYQAVAKVSKATATRHLSDLLEKDCIERRPKAGAAPVTRSTLST